MRIEEVEVLAFHANDYNHTDIHGVAQQAVEALRADAWYPIEKAEEMGVLDNSDVLIYFRSWGKYLVRVAKWDRHVKGWLIHGDFCINDGVTHFKRIAPPGN